MQGNRIPGETNEEGFFNTAVKRLKAEGLDPVLVEEFIIFFKQGGGTDEVPGPLEGTCALAAQRSISILKKASLLEDKAALATIKEDFGRPNQTWFPRAEGLAVIKRGCKGNIQHYQMLSREILKLQGNDKIYAQIFAEGLLILHSKSVVSL